MKINKQNELVYYGSVLSKLDIITVGLYIVRYEQRQITYKELKEVLKLKGIELKPYLRDISTHIMTICYYEGLKSKFANEEYDPNDLNGYIISNDRYKNILIRYDRLMLKVLAEYGDEYSKQALERTIEWEKKLLERNKIK